MAKLLNLLNIIKFAINVLQICIRMIFKCVKIAHMEVVAPKVF